MKIKPFEVANAHLLKHERQYYRKGVDDCMAWSDDKMPLHVQFDNDEEEEDSKHCFDSCNTIEHPILRNMNGLGKLTHASDKDMQETTEQFAWSRPRKLKHDIDAKMSLADMLTPVPILKTVRKKKHTRKHKR